jgi:hypothetical protein
MNFQLNIIQYYHIRYPVNETISQVQKLRSLTDMQRPARTSNCPSSQALIKEHGTSNNENV